MRNALLSAIALYALLDVGVLTPAPAPAQATASRAETTRGPVALSYDTYRLPNGLNVVLSRDTSVPVVAVNLWYHVGSADEDPGRTGFAHLFEHMMFQGSEHVGEDQHFKIVQEAGGSLNGSTNPDRTNYYEAAPSNFLETLLWLESDRMGFLLPAMTQQKLDNQRDVVKNERRQRYENQPYGLAQETIREMLYPKGHPYHHTTIGSMADLSAASMEDVQAFFRRYYTPNNASLVIRGDFDPAEAKRLVARYFGPIPQGPAVNRPQVAPVRLQEARYRVLEDRVQLPQLYQVWPTPARFAEGDAELDVLGLILADGKNSRLYRRLVYEDQLAQWVSASQNGQSLAGQFGVTVRAKAGVDLDRIEQIVNEEVERIRREPPSPREVERAVNNIEASFIRRLQSNLAVADQLNAYAVYTGNPGYLGEDLGRYRAVTPQAVQQAARQYLGTGRVVLSVVPQGKLDLQASP
ncbi:MAG TPA: pitrilysin family protein [Longimicrobiaceae bacterium]|nr:pitrilysin family protein [Longimicrobiaceae bacterium]